jgi:ABC-type branched-subunit amino acid transport system substrate-binding protein
MSPQGEPNEGRLLALIIGTASYTDPTLTRLRAPGHDARDLAEVLGDETIGGFKVQTVLDAPANTIRRRVARFCADAGPHDLALVYLSCHGVLDDRGQLHYAAMDTERALLAATTVEATWLNQQLDSCRSRRQILILDCCHSGAFARGTKGTSDLGLRHRFEARGRIVLTASRATEYAFEGDRIVGEHTQASAVFTGALVEGLRSGDADRDGDGEITVTELYDYANRVVGSREERQRPGLWVVGGEGEIVIARNPHAGVVEPKPLSDDLIDATQSLHPKIRIGAVAVLADLLFGPDPGLRMSACGRLQQIAKDDIAVVAGPARAALARYLAVEEPEPPAPEPHVSTTHEHDPVVAEKGSVGPPPPSRPPVPSPPVDHDAPPPPSRRPRAWPRIPVLKKSGLVLAAMLVAGAAAATQVPSAGPAAVRVGAIYSVTGSDRNLGRDVLDGARFAVDYVNGTDGLKSTLPLGGAAGLPGLDGAKLELVERNIHAKRCSVQSAFTQLVDHDRVAAVIGAGQSTFTLRALSAAVTHKPHVPLVNDISSASSLTEHIAAKPGQDPGRRVPGTCPTNVPRPSPWFFRVGPSDALAAKVFFDLIDAAERTGTRVRRVAILRENDDIFGNDGAAATIKLANERGIAFKNLGYHTVVGAAKSDAQVSCGSANGRAVVHELDRQVIKIKKYRPDVVFALSYGPDAIAAVQMMKKHHYKPPVMLAYGTGFASSTFVRDALKPNKSCKLRGADPSGIVVRTSGSADVTNPSTPAASIAQRFEHSVHRKMNSRSAGGFTAMLTLAQAIDEAASTDPRRIQAALNHLDLPASATILPWTGIRFDHSGQNTRAGVVLQIVKQRAAGTDPTNLDLRDAGVVHEIFKRVKRHT